MLCFVREGRIWNSYAIFVSFFFLLFIAATACYVSYTEKQAPFLPLQQFN